MRNPKISAARAARAKYKQDLKRLASYARDARAMYAITLRELAIDRFIKLYPQETWPEWMERLASFNVEFNESNICKVSITIRVDGPMPDEYFWYEYPDRGRVLACLNEDGETRFILHFTSRPLEIITLFEAQVDPESLAVSIVVSHNPATTILPPPEFFYDGW
jgi:hypothetical protein